MGTVDCAAGDKCVLSAFGRQKQGSKFKVFIVDFDMCTLLKWCYVRAGGHSDALAE